MKLLTLASVLLLSITAQAKTVSIMSYNVQNLFDTQHDEGKEDYTYLPLKVKEASSEIQAYCKSLAKESWQKSCLFTDWNEDVLKQKILNLSKVIKKHKCGKGADVLVLQEVENKRVLEQLVDIGLKGKGYKYISLIEGPDSRGIDVGVISKYPIVKEELHTVDLEGIAKSTRGILQVDIKVNNKIITIFGNHWPSQHNPAMARFEAAKTLKAAASKVKSNIVIATGDFNTLENELPNGIKEVIMPDFYDAEIEALKRWKRLFAGTHWFAGHWSSLDKMFVLKNIDNVKVKFRSFKIQAKRFQLGPKKWTDRDTGTVTHYTGVPQSFSDRSKVGYSDHLPILIKIKL